MSLRHSAVCLLILLVLGCGEVFTDAGSFSMSFSWDTAPAAKVWIWVRVEERTDPTVAGKFLASAGPEAYELGESVSLAMSEVTNCDNRYVVAEVREGANPGLPILYYGISEPFSLAAGKHTHVDVPMVMQVPEALSMEASVELLFGGEIRARVGLTEIVDATLSTGSVNAVSIVLANDASLSANATEVALDDPDAISCSEEEEAATTWDLCTLTGWDLTAELDGELADQQYTLFVKFVDRYGYESGVYRASVVLDSQGPLVLLASLTPAVAHPGADVFLSVTFHEPLAEQDGFATLHISPLLPPGSALAGPERIGTSTAYLWTLALTQDWSGSDEFSFTVDAEDLLGNKSPTQPLVDQEAAELRLTVDPTPPALVAGAGEGFSQTLFGLPDAGAKLAFEFCRPGRKECRSRRSGPACPPTTAATSKCLRSPKQR